jgi:hypothetical protein
MFSQSGTPSNESGMMEEGSVTPATRLGQIPASFGYFYVSFG